MIKKIVIFLIFFILCINTVDAADIVFPSSKHTVINSYSTFFFGNVREKETLKINSEQVKIWDDGVFVHIVPLYYGENKIKIESTYKGKKHLQTYIVKRNKINNKSVLNYPLPKYIPKKNGIYLYTKTIKDNSTVRKGASKSTQRIIDLPKGIVLYLAGKKGDYYKIEETGDTEFWIHKSNIEKPVEVTKKFYAGINKTAENYSDKLYNYTKIYISHPVLYTFKQEGKILKLTLYGTSYSSDSEGKKNTEFNFNDNKTVLGYDGHYEEGCFIVRRAKTADNINKYTPLYGTRIHIDAGHGGHDKGAYGPSRVNEKDINLAISKKLIQLLKKEGAKVSYSRLNDKYVKLYDRVNMAKENNALILLSIHNNSLPHGKNPYVTHGTETYYYNDNAKDLAVIIRKNLVKDLDLKDNGTRKASLALNRSTNPVSVLIEIAYMINPQEYTKLKSEVFQYKAALSIKKSLEEYMLLLQK